jgi:hypothetical protein
MITRDASKYLPQMGLSPSEAERRNCESSGCPLLRFRMGLLSEPQRLNPFDNMENYDEEGHTLRCSCNSVYIA